MTDWFFCGEGLSSDSADPYAIEGIKSDPAATALSPSSCLLVMRSACSISTLSRVSLCEHTGIFASAA